MKMAKKKKHRWDETLVIIVMVAAAIAILLLLSKSVVVTGKAPGGIVPTQAGVAKMFNEAQVKTIVGISNCNIVCGEDTCLIARFNDKLVSCDLRVKSEAEHTCLCGKPPG